MRSFSKHTILSFGVCSTLYLAFVLPLISVASDDVRMADVFSVDESGATAVVRHLHRLGGYELQSFTYGGVFYYAPLLFLNLIDFLGMEVNDHVIILVMRGMCSAAGLGCVWITLRLGAMVFHRTTGLLAAMLLIISPPFLRWSVFTHPDLPQLLWILLALLCCCRLSDQFSLKWMALSSLFAALVFGTKYAGLFLLPIIALSAVMPSDAGYFGLDSWAERLKDRRVLYSLIAIPAVFAVAFAVTNPYALIHFDLFEARLQSEKEILSFGFRVAETAGWRSWAKGLTQTIGWVSATLFAVYALTGIFAVTRVKRVRSGRALLGCWVLLFFSFLAIEINVQRERHLLPILPCVLLFVGESYRRFGLQLGRRLGGNLAPALVGVVVALAFAQGHIGRAFGMFKEIGNREEGRVELSAGRWLSENFPEQTTILFDAYSYVPEKFRNVHRTFGMTYPMVNHFEPDLLVVRDAMAGRYANLEDADRARVGGAAFLDRHYFYKYLSERRLSTYDRIKEFERIGIYERNAPKVRKGTEPASAWPERLKQYAAGTVYGVPKARKSMAAIHEAVGLNAESERELRLAEEAESHPVEQYNLATMHLSEGRTESARSLFDEVMSAISSQSAAQRASVQHHIARQYFEAGLYSEAIAWTREAIELNPDLKEAHFDLGAFTLAQGDFLRGDSLFVGAVQHYGADPYAKDLLRMLIRRGLGAGGPRRILNRYFGGDE